jgi:hypothetical protein
MWEQMVMSGKENNQCVEGCPMHAERPALEVDEELVFPKLNRVVAQYLIDKSGVKKLHIYYGEKEITFEEPELFAFGEGLAAHERFVEGDAIAWGDGCEWEQVRELLEQLIDEEILRRMDDHASDPYSTLTGYRPYSFPPAESVVPRTWYKCEAIARELTGHALELRYLESIVPIYRVTYIAMDAEERQAGETNVHPKPLRFDIH